MNVSIGQIGIPYFDKANNRTKAFAVDICHSLAEIEQVIVRTLGILCTGDRFAIRVLTRGIDKEILRHSTFHYHNMQINFEAMILIDGFDNYIIYYGWNRPAVRTTPCEQLQAQLELLGKVSIREHKPKVFGSNVVVRVFVGGEKWARFDVLRLLEIYTHAFSGYLVDFTYQSICEMLASNITAVTLVNGEIVAVAMAEIAEINKHLTIAEISEVATHQDFQRQGFAFLAMSNLIKKLDTMKLDVIFSEVRAASFGMMAVAIDCGLIPCGNLPKHCVISSPFSEVSQSDKYGDLVVFTKLPRV